jgi:hypothetical protein
MRRPKRIVFTAAKPVDIQGTLAMLQAVSQMTGAVSRAISSMHGVVKAVGRFGRSVAASPEFQQELKLQQLYFESWQENELADTLRQAGIG